MTLFIFSAVAWALAALVLMAFLGLWTYKDAQVKSDHSPVLWVLVVLLVPNFLGLVVYLLVGRTNKQKPAPGTFKTPLLIFVALTVITFALFIGSAVRFAVEEGGNWSTTGYQRGVMIDAFGNARRGTFFGLSTNRRNEEWRVTAVRGNGFIQTSPRLDESQLAQLYVNGHASEGEIFLRLEQDGRVEEVHITEFSGAIDASDFTPGRVRMIVLFEHARDVRVRVSWSGN